MTMADSATIVAVRDAAAADNDAILVARLLRMRALVRRQARRCQAAYDAQVALNTEIGDRQTVYAKHPTDPRYYLTYRGLPGKDTFAMSVDKVEDVKEPLRHELGERCRAAEILWRMRAIRLSRATLALRDLVERLVGDPLAMSPKDTQ